MNGFIVFGVVLIIICVLGAIRKLNFLHHSHNDESVMESAIVAMIEANGGTNVVVRPHPAVSPQAHRIIVTYRDAQGENQIYHVTQQLNRQGRLNGGMVWSDPVTNMPFVMNMPSPTASISVFASVSTSVSASSKEQIINDMDAEIQRLRGVLAAAGIEDSHSTI